MDKIYSVAYHADYALKKSSFMLDDERLFGSSYSSALKGCDEELDEVFGKTKEINLMKGKRISKSVACSHSWIIFHLWSVTMNMINIKDFSLIAIIQQPQSKRKY